MVTVLPIPAFFKVTTPLEVTVAYFLLLVFHVTARFFAVVGVTVAVSLIFLPAAICLEIPVILILLTLICVHFAVKVVFALTGVAKLYAVLPAYQPANL